MPDLFSNRSSPAGSVGRVSGGGGVEARRPRDRGRGGQLRGPEAERGTEIGSLFWVEMELRDVTR